jgi:hypothetical protein
LTIFAKRGDERVGETVTRAESREHAILQPRESVRRADPQSALRILGQRADMVVRKRLGIGAVKNVEVLSVESNEPFLRAEPDETVVRLEHRLNRVLRQALRGLPHRVHVLGQCLVRVERHSGHADQQHRGNYCQCAYNSVRSHRSRS